MKLKRCIFNMQTSAVNYYFVNDLSLFSIIQVFKALDDLRGDLKNLENAIYSNMLARTSAVEPLDFVPLQAEWEECRSNCHNNASDIITVADDEKEEEALDDAMNDDDKYMETILYVRKTNAKIKETTLAIGKSIRSHLEKKSDKQVGLITWFLPSSNPSNVVPNLMLLRETLDVLISAPTHPAYRLQEMNDDALFYHIESYIAEHRIMDALQSDFDNSFGECPINVDELKQLRRDIFGADTEGRNSKKDALSEMIATAKSMFNDIADGICSVTDNAGAVCAISIC